MLENYNKKNGVYLLTDLNSGFASNYIELRKKEGRIIHDSELKNLPDTTSENIYHKEWKLRKKSTTRFLDHTKTNKAIVLDIGCGNGWFSNHIAKNNHHCRVYAIDVNLFELEQAARVFTDPNLNFLYGDIFKLDKSFSNSFDIITMNACVQYFKDFVKLKTKIMDLLKIKGTFHILDSPFYKDEEIESAKQRTKNYYQRMGFPEMSKNYFHHSVSLLEDAQILYRPRFNKLKKLINAEDSPFMWVCFSKKN